MSSGRTNAVSGGGGDVTGTVNFSGGASGTRIYGNSSGVETQGGRYAGEIKVTRNSILALGESGPATISGGITLVQENSGGLAGYTGFYYITDDFTMSL